jgi:purine nucleosidase
MSEFQSAFHQFAPLCLIRQAKTARPGRQFVFSLVFLLFVFPVAGPLFAETVWIDTDPSIGSPFRDVDDAFALLLAARSPNLTIAGISTTYGNASLQTTTAAARLVLSKLNSRVPVHPGAQAPRDRARQTEATEALAATLRQKRSVTYLALGPLTNLAAFQAVHPDLARRIKRVIFIGGTTSQNDLRFGSRHPIHIHDANVAKDPASVAQVLRSRIPITLISIGTASLLRVTAADLDAMRADPAGDFIQKKSRFWLWFWTKFVGTEGAPIFDAAAILLVAEPAQFEMRTRVASVDADGNLVVLSTRRSEGRDGLLVVRMSKPANALNSVRRRLRSSAGRGPGSDHGRPESPPTAPPAIR